MGETDDLIPFSDLPYGARFRYPGHDRVYTLLSRSRLLDDEPCSGTIAEWQPGMLGLGQWSGQGIFSHIATDPDCPEMVIGVD